MYLEYFGLSDYPFDGLPDRRYYYVGGAHHQSLSLLSAALSRSGCLCVFTGESGSGKTTLVRMLMRSLPRRMRIISIDDPRLDPQMLLATMLRASGVVATSFESIAELTLKVRQMLERSIAQGIITTVICDEAQGLSDDVLEQIRLISNIEGEAGKMINFLLVGREDLLNHLNKPEHEMLRNRIKIFTTLPRLKESEVGAYLTFRLQKSGCLRPVFTNKAIAAIARHSNGAPRLINAIADMCLTLAAQKKSEQVNGSIARKAAAMVLHHQQGGIAGYVRNFMREAMSLSLYARIGTIAGAALCAALAFGGALAIMKYYYPVQTLENALISDEQIKQRYTMVADYLLKGRNAASREVYFFNHAISQSYFKSEALATLFKIHGYAVADAEQGISNEVLRSVNLQRFYQTGSFEEAISYNTPVLISLIDDNLTPFYAVLYSLNEDVAQLVIGDYMFSVKASYIKDRFMGQYTLLHPYIGNLSELKSRMTDVRKNAENRLRPFLNAYRNRALESANREAYAALIKFEKQKDEVNKLRQMIRQQVLSSLNSEHKSDAQLEKELKSSINSALEQNEEFQSASTLLKKLEEISAAREVRADEIRTISLRLDDGYRRAMDLFLQEQRLSEVNQRAAALLTLSGYDGPRLITVVPGEAESETGQAPAASGQAAGAPGGKTTAIEAPQPEKKK